MFVRHIVAAAIKLLIIINILGMIYGESFSNIFMVSFILTLASYTIGDLFILRRTRQRTALAFDVVFTFGTVWILGAILFDQQVPLLLSSLYATAAIGFTEWLFHRYILRILFKSKRSAA